ncbi:PREDICTED: uncharacterized protein LOC105316861 [Amphimedon queenslandica]|uniref:Lysine-specific metallo-endopeptidase domain-containing protein n=2 Tax=Amphimedon queenslandica TaxID=400682 RepID=A0AAN0IVV6_AMPQE|nr:PREDICTED: uncharacterized protein LOC105316861 [Amphimedon queenslandica]|eukprot:XP_011410402.2 PREDICTED: uncharacterized protein LOC105316861 [Amphimedon queenslandica]
MKTFIIVSLLSCVLAMPPTGWPISVDMGCSKYISAVACSFEFTNIANEALYLLKRGTPLEGLFSQFLTVSVAGSPVEYDGPFVFYTPLTKDEFVLLKAGERISASVQITDAFSIDTDGLYTVQYSKPLLYLSVNEMSELSNGQLRESTVQESIHIYLEDTHALLKPRRPKETDKIDYTVNIESCSTASFTGSKNNSGTLDAHKRLCAGIDKVKGKLKNNKLYRTWFGAYDASRFTTVSNVYNYMRNGLASKSVRYYNNGPSCKSNWVAYTYRSYSGTTVYLCNSFYKYPTACRGTKYTKERVLLHEWAHALGGRSDEAYYADNCKKLAKNEPARAIKNADSFSFHYCKSQ